MTSVSFDHVTKRFEKVVALDDLTFEVMDREFLVLVGPSGCGKTTALRCLAGLEDVTQGTIRINDRVVNDVPPKDRNIAMVFQSYALYPHMSVFDNMAFGLKLRKIPKREIERRVGEAADILDLSDLLKRKPKQLSGGQRQRVAVGRAIVREPSVFLFDEPLSNLDAKLRVQTRAQLSKLHHRLQTTFIYVTHDQTEAMTMATRIAVMRDGLLQQLDTPQRLYEHPLNIFVAGFIGSPAMNLIDARVVRSDGGLVIDCDAFHFPVPMERLSTLQTHAGRNVILGIRPENIHDTNFVPPGIVETRIDAEVDVTELMGNEVFVSLQAGVHPLIARVDPRTQARIGQRMQLSLDVGHVHLFDPDTELAIR